MQLCYPKIALTIVQVLLLRAALIKAGGATRQSFGLDCPPGNPRQCLTSPHLPLLTVRGGGRAPVSANNFKSRVASCLVDPFTAAGSGIASVWNDHVSPALQSWKGQFSNDKDDKRNGRRNDVNTRSYTRSASDPTTATKLSALLLPSRIFKLTLLALLIAEGLDRIGILYEDTPALLKSRLDEYWRYTLHPKLVRCREKMQLFYWNRVEPLMPESILYSDFYNDPLSLSALFTTKVAFAVGASLGMIASPLLAAWMCRFWKPIVGVYGLAELNHYCNRHGSKFVRWLGETPETLGTTLNGILNQILNLVRGVVFGRRQTAETGGGERNRISMIFAGDSSMLPLLGGGEQQFGKGVRAESDYSLGFSSKSKDDSEFQGLLEEFRDWMIVSGNSRVGSQPIREKRDFAVKGFWLGCCLGFALFRIELTDNV